MRTQSINKTTINASSTSQNLHYLLPIIITVCIYVAL